MPKKTKKNNPRYVVGIDLGGTKILAAVVDDKGQVLGRSKRKTRGKTDNATDPETVTDRVVTCVQDAVAAAGLKLGDIAAVGASAPGPVNVETGFVARMANLPGWEEGFAFGPELSKRLKLPVWVDNDVNLGTLGEVVYGAGRGMKDVIGIFVGTGIGGGIVLGGKLRRGVRWAAGEIGHMFVDISAVQRGGPVCGCGEPGHVEAIASRGAISRRLAAAIAAGEPTLLATEVKDESDLTSGAIRRAWEAGDELTRRVIAETQEVMGLLIASVVNLLDPEGIILGGGLVESLGDAYVEPVRRHAYAHFFLPDRAGEVKIMRAALGDDATILGAAVLARSGL